MDEMLALRGSHEPCFLFEQLFLERLPEDIRIQLADVKFDKPRDLAKRADKLWLSREMGTISAVQRNRSPPPPEEAKVPTKTQIDTPSPTGFQ